MSVVACNQTAKNDLFPKLLRNAVQNATAVDSNCETTRTMHTAPAYAAPGWGKSITVTFAHLAELRKQEGRSPITTQQALGAPIAASVSLFGVFAILKYTDISVGLAYQVCLYVLEWTGSSPGRDYRDQHSCACFLS